MTRRETLALLGAQGVPRERAARKPYIVLLAGAAGSNAERTLPQLAQELETRHGMRCNVLEAASRNDLPGLDALEDADAALMYLDSLALPPDQMKQVQTYVQSGMPIVAMRTSLRAFGNWPEFGPQVLGATWQYDYGEESGTEVSVIQEAAADPVLQRLARNFQCRSSLYHVLPLPSNVKPLLMGRPVGTVSRPERTANPVAWTRTVRRTRVFYTSLGHADDFALQPFRQLMANAVRWALSR